MTIWAPFSLNEHHFADYLRGGGYKVINTHIETGQDFFSFKPNFHFDVIIDNPPFKNKTAFLKKVIEYGKPFALLLPLHTFGIKAPVKLFIDAGLEPQMLIPEARINFHNQSKKSIAFKTIYICNKLLPKQIILTNKEVKNE
jgi:hypothetical protein